MERMEKIRNGSMNIEKTEEEGDEKRKRKWWDWDRDKRIIEVGRGGRIKEEGGKKMRERGGRMEDRRGG